MYEKLPEELRINGKFCLWRYEMRKGNQTKVPYRTDGRRADSTKAADFSSFENVTAILAHEGYNGIRDIVVAICDCNYAKREPFLFFHGTIVFIYKQFQQAAQGALVFI